LRGPRYINFSYVLSEYQYLEKNRLK